MIRSFGCSSAIDQASTAGLRSNAVIDPHISGANHTLYEIGRIALTFALIGLAIWMVIKLMVRAGNRGSDRGVSGVNRQQRRAERAKAKRKRR